MINCVSSLSDAGFPFRMDFSTFPEKSNRRCCFYRSSIVTHRALFTIVIPFSRTRSRTLFFMFIFWFASHHTTRNGYRPFTRAVKTLCVVIIIVVPTSQLQWFLMPFPFVFLLPESVAFIWFTAFPSPLGGGQPLLCVSWDVGGWR